MTRQEWSKLKPGMKIRLEGGVFTYEVTGVRPYPINSTYPDYCIFSPMGPFRSAMVCENWEVVK